RRRAGGGAVSERLTDRAPALELRGVAKRFGANAALDGASLVVRAGTLHAVLGENGAGKTTLMRVAFGMLRPDAGAVEVLVGRVGAAAAGDREGARARRADAHPRRADGSAHPGGVARAAGVAARVRGGGTRAYGGARDAPPARRVIVCRRGDGAAARAHGGER